MSYSLDAFFKDVNSKQYSVLNVDLNQNGTQIASLQRELQMLPNSNGNIKKTIEELVESQRFYSGKWTRFNMMLTSFLLMAKDIDPWSTWNSCDLIFQFYSDLNNCLLNDTYPVDDIVGIYLEVTEYIIPLGISLDDMYLSLKTKKHQFLSHISSVISKLFNSIKPHNIMDNNTGNGNNATEITMNTLPGKQRILLNIVNKLNNIYFRIQAPQLCSNIFRNFKPKSSMDMFSKYPLNEQIEYRYLLGRYYLLNSRITNSFVQLNSSFSMIQKVVEIKNSTSSSNSLNNVIIIRNLKRILRYLIPVGLIMGKLPKFSFIYQIDQTMANKYSSLVQIVRSGNIFGLNQWLQSNETELKHRHLLLILLEKLSIVTYRYLVRRVIQEWSISQNSNRLPYDILISSLQISIKDANNQKNDKITIYNGIHSSENAENILVTLINLGYLRGNCFPTMKLCVFQRTTNVKDILPPIERKMISMFPLNEGDAWLEK